MRPNDPAILRTMAPTSQERWYFPDPPTVARPTIIYFEKWSAGTILRCQVLVNKLPPMAIVLGDEDEPAKGFGGANSESKAVKYVEALGYVQAVDWRLPPPAN
jgi:hypothetical protein